MAADRGVVPGSNGNGSASGGAHLLSCNIPSPLQNSAVIGANGGVLDIGPHRFIVPPGALTRPLLISGTVRSVNGHVEIDFEPSGTQFKKPAGLVFDASSCGPVPGAVYLNPLGTNEFIPAIYSNWWHTIAAPIEHFSAYSIGV